MSIGISAGINGFVRGMMQGQQIRDHREDREWQRETRTEDREWRREDREWQRETRAEDRDWVQQQRGWAVSDREWDVNERKRLAAERKSDRDWSREGRRRQREIWEREDTVFEREEAERQRQADLDTQEQRLLSEAIGGGGIGLDTGPQDRRPSSGQPAGAPPTSEVGPRVSRASEPLSGNTDVGPRVSRLPDAGQPVEGGERRSPGIIPASEERPRRQPDRPAAQDLPSRTEGMFGDDVATDDDADLAEQEAQSSTEGSGPSNYRGIEEALRGRGPGWSDYVSQTQGYESQQPKDLPDSYVDLLSERSAPAPRMAEDDGAGSMQVEIGGTDRDAPPERPVETSPAAEEPAPQTTPEGTPAPSARMIQQVSQSIGLGGNVPSEEQRDRGARDFQRHYDEDVAPRLVEFYRQNGEFEKAQAFEAYLRDEQVRRGMGHWSRAIMAAQIGDEREFIEQLSSAYNTDGYYDDGLSIDPQGTKFIRDGDDIIGADLTFINDRTGERFNRQYESEDLYRLGIDQLSMESAFEDQFARYQQVNNPDAPAAIQTLRIRAQEAGLEPGSPEYEDFMMNGGPREADKPADEYQRYVAEEEEAGREPLSRIDYAQAKKGEGVVMTTPDGTQLRVGGSGQQSTGLQPSSPEAMIATLDGILNDEALGVSTGMLAPLQHIPGTPMKRFQTRVNQLNGQAFLQAFESLKGAGQITEIEGTKATQAIGRLDAAQSAEDYRSALTDLRAILAAGRQRPEGWVRTQQQQAEARNVIPAAEAQSMTPDAIRALGPEGLERLPIGEMRNLSDEQWDALEELASQ